MRKGNLVQAESRSCAGSIPFAHLNVDVYRCLPGVNGFRFHSSLNVRCISLPRNEYDVFSHGALDTLKSCCSADNCGKGNLQPSSTEQEILRISRQRCLHALLCCAMPWIHLRNRMGDSGRQLNEGVGSYRTIWFIGMSLGLERAASRQGSLTGKDCSTELERVCHYLK